MPADQQAVHPLRVVVGVEREVAGLLQHRLEHGAGFDARESGPDAEVDAVTKGLVTLRGSAGQVDLVGVVRAAGYRPRHTPPVARKPAAESEHATR
jgi:hypothetical protein